MPTNFSWSYPVTSLCKFSKLQHYKVLIALASLAKYNACYIDFIVEYRQCQSYIILEKDLFRFANLLSYKNLHILLKVTCNLHTPSLSTCLFRQVHTYF